jgi:hypothetical protein
MATSLGMATDTATVTAATTMAMLVNGVDGNDGDDGSSVEEIGGGGGGSGDRGGNGCGNALGQLPSVNDATFVMTAFLTRQARLMRCRASARGCPPTTDSIRHHIDDDDVG